MDPHKADNHNQIPDTALGTAVEPADMPNPEISVASEEALIRRFFEQDHPDKTLVTRQREIRADFSHREWAETLERLGLTDTFERDNAAWLMGELNRGVRDALEQLQEAGVIESGLPSLYFYDDAPDETADSTNAAAVEQVGGYIIGTNVIALSRSVLLKHARETPVAHYSEEIRGVISFNGDHALYYYLFGFEEMRHRLRAPKLLANGETLYDPRLARLMNQAIEDSSSNRSPITIHDAQPLERDWLEAATHLPRVQTGPMKQIIEDRLEAANTFFGRLDSLSRE